MDVRGMLEIIFVAKLNGIKIKVLRVVTSGRGRVEVEREHVRILISRVEEPVEPNGDLFGRSYLLPAG